MNDFDLKDSGERQSFSSGMVRDTTEGKTNFLNVFFGPMLTRWATHLTKGRVKYSDVAPGTPNWTLAKGQEEYLRAKESAVRHFFQWLRGDRDEDHASAVFFNINLAEYVLEQTEIDPALGAAVVPDVDTEESAPCDPSLAFIVGPGEGACGHVSPSYWGCERVAGHCGDHGIEPGLYSSVARKDEAWPAE